MSVCVPCCVSSVGCGNSKHAADTTSQSNGERHPSGQLTTSEILERIDAPARSENVDIGGYKLRYVR